MFVTKTFKNWFNEWLFFVLFDFPDSHDSCGTKKYWWTQKKREKLAESFHMQIKRTEKIIGETLALYHCCVQALAQPFTTKASSDLLKTSNGQRFINNPTCQPKLKVKVKVNSRYYFDVSSESFECYEHCQRKYGYFRFFYLTFLWWKSRI